jgi:hypothetical protein
MGDDEVLKLAGWGPSRQDCSEAHPRGWQEEWTYELRAANAATLRFVNARLAAVEVQPPYVLVASEALTQQ